MGQWVRNIDSIGKCRLCDYLKVKVSQSLYPHPSHRIFLLFVPKIYSFLEKITEPYTEIDQNRFTQFHLCKACSVAWPFCQSSVYTLCARLSFATFLEPPLLHLVKHLMSCSFMTSDNTSSEFLGMVCSPPENRACHCNSDPQRFLLFSSFFFFNHCHNLSSGLYLLLSRTPGTPLQRNV